MQLKVFDKNEKQKNNKTTILVVVVFLFVVTLVLGKSFAYYKQEEDKKIVSGVAEICPIASGTTWNFEYKGYEQEFVAPCVGNYRLETWGAQGGADGPGYGTVSYGGYGGYSKGEVSLASKTTLYINVGQNLATNWSLNGTTAYNGGGAISNSGAAGGGATHIATESGVLKNLSSNIDSILIVSGGGGGAGDFAGGGSGGGYVGNNGIGTSSGLGGSQSNGNGFGVGQNAYEQNAAGGGGFYGGYRGTGGTSGGGGGGSSYIGNEKLINKIMNCYNCAESNEISTRTVSTTNVSEDPISGYAKKGHGYAKITYLGYSDSELNGADPVLKDGLIPVKIESDGTVKKANPQVKWYDYGNKEWANAVILMDKTKLYDYGDIIPESNIESYFVWIPKYSYQLWDLGNYNGAVTGKPTTSNEREIQIRFGLANTNDSNTGECTTPMTSGGSGNCSIGDWMTHPAFISMNTTGLWVGKFETGYKGATSTAQAEVNSIDATKIIVKPNVYSWRNNTVYNHFVSAYNYQRTMDSHMMKNTEWGAVAYLSHSKYGIMDNIRINNNSAYLTGYAAINKPTIGTVSASQSGNVFESTSGGVVGTVTSPYNTEAGYKASTTGNITGIYDISGGSHDVLSAHVNGNYGNSGFNATNIASYNSKYFDVYNSSSGTSYQYRILGGAIGEMGPFYQYADGDGSTRYHNWYEAFSLFIEGWSSWIYRGGSYYNGLLAGQFTFSISAGEAHPALGTRIVLSP